tara:strand:- start:228 stop:1664 length:1437 start_codon:yes stop_codon:yes gene_type:complete
MTTAKPRTKNEERLPPHSLEAERGALGCILLDPDRSLPDCIEQLPALGKVFYDLRHQLIYDQCVEMHHAGEAVDLTTLATRLKDAGRLSELGGIGGLTELQDTVPSALNLPAYLEILREKHTTREILRACSLTIENVFDTAVQGGSAKLLEEANRIFTGVQETRPESTLVTAREGAKKLCDILDTYTRGIGIPGGLKSGLHYYDKMLGGMFPQEYAVLAGRPGSGKTSFALNLIEAVALGQEQPCGLFSLEMTTAQLMLRWACQHGRVNLQKFRTGYLDNADFPKLTTASLKLANAPIWIDDRSGITVHEIRSKSRRLVKEHGVKFIVIDYLQLIRSSDPRLVREQQVAEISAELLAMAKELHIPILVLAQLNRQSESADRGNHGPKLSDLRESGSVEQDAHNVTILWNPKPKTDDEEARLEQWQERFGGAADDWADKVQWVRARICKNRNGPTGDCDLVFRKAHMNFLDPNDRHHHQ